MSRNSREMTADTQHVWEVLSDGWLYPLWVVGASRMREVDDAWPAVGAQLHHSVGSWPLLLDDTTEVKACDPGVRLVVQARAWPSGEAEVTLTLRSLGPGRTEVEIREQAVSGPGRLVPRLLQDPPLAWRNVETLRRLAFIVENRP
ncbi:SRPBCC family protein [soil metagenome]